MVRFLVSEFQDTPVFLILTTHVADPECDRRVVKRNEAVKKIADRYGLTVIDFYAPAAERPELISGDGVHFTAEGYQVLAETALQALRTVI